MMLDFEDREPSPPMSLGGRIVLAVFVLLTIFGFISQASFAATFAWSAISSLLG